MTTPRIVILGPQGAGKGTQAGRLARRFHIPTISAGEELRREMASGTPLGKRITKTMNAGILIDDQETNAVMSHRLHRPDCRRGWIADGYPRRMGQARPFNRSAHPNVIVLLNLDDQTAIRRLSGRRVCSNGHVYHLRHDPPRRRGRCNHDGLPLRQRDDDTPRAIRQRLHIYHHETEPMLHWYRRRTPILTVDAKVPITSVYRSMLRKLRTVSWLSSRLATK